MTVVVVAQRYFSLTESSDFQSERRALVRIDILDEPSVEDDNALKHSGSLFSSVEQDWERRLSNSDG